MPLIAGPVDAEGSVTGTCEEAVGRTRRFCRALASRGVALPLAAVALAACGPRELDDARDRADARAYVAAARLFDRRAQDVTRSADARAARTFRECSLVRLGDAKVPPLSRLVGITVVAYYQALLPDYARYARRLAAVRARDPTLAGVAQAARSLGRHYASVRTAHPDYCHALRLWRAAHWTKSFSVMAAIGVSRRVFDERAYPQLPVILREEVTVATSGDRLRDLGVGEAGVRAFLLATDAFAAARGGYTEVVNLARR